MRNFNNNNNNNNEKIDNFFKIWGMDNRKGHNYQNRDFEKIEKKICISNNLYIVFKTLTENISKFY